MIGANFIDPSKCWSGSKAMVEHKELLKSMKENEEKLEEIYKKSKLELSMEKMVELRDGEKLGDAKTELEKSQERLLDLTA